ncbi:Gfo/Idh/MocA family protein [Teichococcus aestuarii]|uniref:Gfo/Idh/MocA family protein n=1 Tax=Teichococcus aestuarii TaxID=568898 RepID=UPI0036227F5D
MADRRIGIVMNGVTGRMGMNQHLIRSIAAIRQEGGVRLANGDRLMPDPILVGRNREKLEALARAYNIVRVTTDIEAALADPQDEIFFDAAATALRAGLIRRAIAAGKHIYCEKPSAENLQDALDLARRARRGSRTASCRTSCSCPACAS